MLHHGFGGGSDAGGRNRPYRFTPGNISRTLMEDYVAEVGAN